MKKKQVVIDFIQNKINSGEYTPNKKIMSEPMIAQYLGISRNTVREALKELEFSGVVSRERGNGTFIKDNENNSKRKQYILFISNEKSTDGYIRKNYKYIIDLIKNYILEKGYKPICYISNDTLSIYDSLSVIIDEIAGIISFCGYDKDLKFFNNINIPIIDTITTFSREYPSVIFSYEQFYRYINNFIIENNYKNNLIFSIKYNIEKYFSAFPFQYENYAYSQYDFHEINYFDTPDYGKSQIINILDKVKKVPDSVIFLDDNLYNLSYDLFDKYSFFKNTKIFTQGNENTKILKDYNICRITFDLHTTAKTTVDMLCKMINGEFIQKYNVKINPIIKDKN